MNNTQFGSNGFVAVIVCPKSVLWCEPQLLPVWQTRIVPLTDQELTLFGHLRFKTQRIAGKRHLVSYWCSEASVEHRRYLSVGEEFGHRFASDPQGPDGYIFNFKFCTSVKEAQSWLAEQVWWSEMVKVQGIR